VTDFRRLSSLCCNCKAEQSTHSTFEYHWVWFTCILEYEHVCL